MLEPPPLLTSCWLRPGNHHQTQELKRRGGPVPLKVYASANRSPLLAGAWQRAGVGMLARLPPCR